MKHRVQVACLALVFLGMGTTITQAAPQEAIIVSDVEGLHAALAPENAGRRIVLLKGHYFVHGPLVVPDGATLDGEGVMQGRGLPDGFAVGTETTITPDPSTPFAGDILTLGHHSRLRSLIVEDIKGRTGNVVAVRSRAPGDTVSASIVQCEILNPNLAGAGPDGPLGRAVVALTSNRAFGAGPPPDEGAEVTATLTQSIVRSTAGSTAIFAINFASHGSVTVIATTNRIFGSFEVTAGVSRPEEVTGASLTVLSDGNIYSALGGTAVGWTIDGGSSAPIPGFVAPGASGNVLRFTSINDRIEGFQTGIAATAAKRHNSTSGANSNNFVDFRAIQLQLETDATKQGAADLILFAAHADGAYPTGDNNRLRVTMIGVSGSGQRANQYANEVGPTGPQLLGIDNKLEIVGDANAFDRINRDIVPAPGAEFFRQRQR